MTAANSARILLVDDDATTRETIADVLRDENYVVIEAVDGRDALERVELQSPDLVITDLSMPRLDGIGLIKAMRARDEPMPIIIITAKPIEEAEDEVRLLGVQGCLSKPIDIDDMLQRIARALIAAMSATM